MVSNILRFPVCCAMVAAMAAFCTSSAFADDVVITVSAESGSVSIDGGTPGKEVSKTVASGTKVKLTYIEGDNPSVGFYQWLDLPLSVYPFNTNVSVTVDSTMTVRVKESGVLYVAPDGDDASGDGTRAQPFGTIQKAMDSVENFGEIRVKGGLYIGCITNGATHNLVKNVSFKGSYNDNWVQDLRNTRTILRSSSAKNTCIVWENVQTNRIDGFDITGGLKGIHAGGENFDRFTSPNLFPAPNLLGPYTHFFITHCIITNNVQHGLYHNVNATAPVNNDGDYGFAVASSLIAFNGMHGVWVKNDQGTDSNCHYYNCTIVSNKSNGIYGYGGFYNKMHNSIVAFNGFGSNTFDLNTGGSVVMYLTDVCAFGGALGSLGSNGGGYVTSDTYLSVDPLFTGFFNLSANSLCNKRGIDLSESTWLPVESDLYGEPWNGEYDLGCIKSAYPKVELAMSDEIWVSCDGSDDNDGSQSSPLRTIASASLKLNRGGTLHIGPGVYTETFALKGDGAKVIGAGCDKTFIETDEGVGFSVTCHNALIEGVTVSATEYGVKIEPVDDILATNVVVRNCVIRNCATGIYMAQDNINAAGYTNRISHCVISNCSQYAIRGKGIHSGANRRGSILVDTSLIVDNQRAYNSDWQPPSGSKNTHTFINCTVVSNKNGLSVGTNLKLFLENSIICDNGSKNFSIVESSVLRLDHTLANGPVEEKKNNVTLINSYTNFTDIAYLKFDQRRSRKYHPTPMSPACRFGKYRDPANDIVDTDLDGNLPKFRRWDAGCYFSNPGGLLLYIR